MAATSQPPTQSRWKTALNTFLNEPLPRGVGWFHSLGSILLFLAILQAFTGLLLALYYSPGAEVAYESIQYIETQVISGKFIRGLHHWTASAFVVILALHILRTFLYAAYKKPRQFTWVLGVLLFLTILGFAFTGYLLPWDMKAYFATRVGIQVAASAPMVGKAMARLLQGGAELSALTLTRFYALHVIVLPLTLLLLIALHVVAVRYFHITPPWKRNDEPVEMTGRFYPDQLARDVVAIVAVFAVIAVLAQSRGAPLEARADPANTSYIPRPDWYFYGLFQLMRLFQGKYEILGTLILPGLFIAILLLIPFIDKNPERAWRKRPLALLAGVFTFLIILGFTFWGGLEG
ncbi:MAG: DUF4405 domain-containing protein, partial [Calditrichaeota bacterium]